MTATYLLPNSAIWFTATFKNDTRIISKAASLHQELVDTLKSSIAPDGDFLALALFQPLPKIVAQRGDNAMGLGRHEHDGLIFMMTVMVREAEQETAAYPECKAYLEMLREFAQSIGGNLNLDWEYLNYADGSQSPLASYGVENVKRLRKISLKYDPEQVFQKLCKGGFKLDQVSP